eukprot:TRINITY_DN7088_c0_g2_i1.p1 TRINITY_DN7088_c0_g2~~TRINITY_DN7088_c0_g2_i1.p1  ORF type:complete len:280 (-),score=47.49 TRINITY_DN7088_c0_g2_i1:216-1055(-)
MEKEGGGDIEFASYVSPKSALTDTIKPILGGPERQTVVLPKETDLDTAAYIESQQTLWKRVLLVGPLSAAGYMAAEKAMQYYMRNKPPHIAIWGMRVVENLHCVTAFINAANAVRTGGRMRNLDYIWSMELGYYFYEMSKVKGLDKVHHLVSIYAYVCLLLNTRFNTDQESARMRNLNHTIIMCMLHFAEPWKDLSRYVALTRFKLLSEIIWVAHHIFYTFRILVWPGLFALRPLMQKDLTSWYTKVPAKCLVGSTVFFVLNLVWMYRKLAKFSWPTAK